MPAADETAAWDDTAAISRSWDRVVDDYKVFHAVHARGGTVDDLPAFPQPETRPDGQSETAGGSSSQAEAKDEHGQEPQRREASVPAGHEHVAAGETPLGGDEPSAGLRTPNPGLLPPQAVLKDGRFPSPETIVATPPADRPADEGLKKLLMSWYYAGYYTGLYEGQQQQQQAQQQTPQAPPQAPSQTAAETDEPEYSVPADQ